MKKPPAVTVLLPTYNRRDYLPRAIDSIVRQTFPDWRLIVLNDGGEDVADIVAGFKDPRIEYVNLPHKGKAGVLNTALKMVESEYVSYMDDDDEVFPEHLRLLYATAVRNNVGFVYSDTFLTRVDRTTGNVINERIENERDVTVDMLRIQNFINHKQIIHRKSLADQIGGFDEELPILIDFDFIRRLAFAEAPHHLRKVTGRHYLFMDGNVASSITGLWYRDPEACGKALLRLYSKTPADLAYAYRSGVIAINKLFDQNQTTRTTTVVTQDAKGKTVPVEMEVRVSLPRKLAGYYAKHGLAATVTRVFQKLLGR